MGGTLTLWTRGLSQMACEGADRQADFPCAAWHGREPIQKSLLLKNKRGWRVSLLMQTQVDWEAPREESKCLCAGTCLPCEEQVMAMIQGSSRGRVSQAAVMLLSPTCSFLFPSQRWRRIGAVEGLAVGLRTADRSIVCHPLSGKVWPPLGDPTLA